MVTQQFSAYRPGAGDGHTAIEQTLEHGLPTQPVDTLSAVPLLFSTCLKA